MQIKDNILNIIFIIINTIIIYLMMIILLLNLQINSFKYIHIILILIYLTITFVLSIFIHELGHLIMGLLSGYKFSSFRIFNKHIQIDKDNIYKIYNKSLPGTLGQCLMAPPKYSDMKVFLYNFGGVLFNIISAIIILLLMLLIKNYYSHLFMASFIISSTLIATTNWMIVDNVSNDGNNYRLIKSDELNKKAFYYLLDMDHHLAINNPISTYDINELEKLELNLNNSLVLNTKMYLYTYYLLVNDLEKFNQSIDNLYNITKDENSIISNLIKTDYYLKALINNDENYQNYKTLEVEKIIKVLKNEENIKTIIILEKYRNNSLNKEEYEVLKKDLLNTYRVNHAKEYINLLDNIIKF